MTSFFSSLSRRGLSLFKLPATRTQCTAQKSFFRSSGSRGTTQQDHAKQQSFRAKRMVLLTPAMLLTGFIPIFTFALGTWQIQRLRWKVDLIDELQEKLQRPPLQLPDYIDIDALSKFAYRKVRTKGHWDNTRTVFIGPRVRDGVKGVNVITPLVREDGSTILVDRGFISGDHANLSRWRNATGSSEEVDVHGMLRLSEKRNSFTPDNHPEKDEWYWVDVNALADHAGGEEANVQPVFVESIFEGHPGEAHFRMSQGVPIGRTPTVEVRNQHASYVLTWYALSAFTTYMFVRLLRKRLNAPAARMPRQ